MCIKLKAYRTPRFQCVLDQKACFTPRFSMCIKSMTLQNVQGEFDSFKELLSECKTGIENQNSPFLLDNVCLRIHHFDVAHLVVQFCHLDSMEIHRA